MNQNKTIQKLVGLLKDIIDNENVSIYPSAIEGNHNTDFEKWETRVKAVIEDLVDINPTKELNT